MEIFDTLTETSEFGPDMTRHRVFGNLMVVNGQLYAVGGDVDDRGEQLTRTIEKFNDQKQLWEHVASFKDERRGFSTCCVGHKIYVFGGSFNQDDRNETYNDTWDVFNTETCSWESSEISSYNRMPIIDDWGQATTMPCTSVTW